MSNTATSLVRLRHRVMEAGMRSSTGLFVLLTAILVTAPLLYFSLTPRNLVWVNIEAASLTGLRLLETSVLTERSAQGVIYFDLKAQVTNPQIRQISIFVHPANVSDWFPAADVQVQSDLILATLQLGSAKYPASDEGRYSYKVVADDSILSLGTIRTTSETLAGGRPWLVAAIGLLASILEIVGVIVSGRRPAQ